MKVLLWDIDGTLLNTDRAGMYAWIEALEEEHGGPVDVGSMSPAGLTDGLIAHQAIEQVLEREHDDDLAAALLRRYVELLPRWLQRRSNGFVHPNVGEILEAATFRDDVDVALLTGNLQAGARLKLGHYGIAHYFEWGGFAEHGVDRRDIARAAHDQARQRHGDAIEAIYVLGDTEHDIDCGKAIGARTIALGTGPYDARWLSRHDPWWAADVLPSPAEFFARLED